MFDDAPIWKIVVSTISIDDDHDLIILLLKMIVIISYINFVLVVVKEGRKLDMEQPATAHTAHIYRYRPLKRRAEKYTPA